MKCSFAGVNSGSFSSQSSQFDSIRLSYKRARIFRTELPRRGSAAARATWKLGNGGTCSGLLTVELCCQVIRSPSISTGRTRLSHRSR